MTDQRGHRRRSAPLGLLAGLAAVPAVVLAGAWQYAEANVPPPTTTVPVTQPPEPAPELTTDLLSFRRHPQPLAERAASATEQARRAELSGSLLDRIGDTSCVRVEGADGVLAEAGDGVAVIPASNQKLLVGAVALDALGPDFRFRTELHSRPPVGGVIDGNVYLVGGGDPVLRTAGIPDPLRYPAFNTTSLDALADQLVSVGITTINGDVVGDGSRYDDEFRVDSWGATITNVDAGPYDALLVNDGLISAGNYGLEPNRAAARTFLDLLLARGITVNGAAANAARPDDPTLTTLALIDSLPLTDVLIEMFHTSDNNTAEMLLKEIGHEVSGQGTRAAGLAAISARLTAWGIPLGGVVLDDGSGLSRNNRVTCDVLFGLVHDVPVAEQLVDLLPAAGRDGTLKDQLRGTAAEATMQAKTGTLTDVKALTGSEPDADGDPVEFSLVLNEPGADGQPLYGPAWEALVELISGSPVTVDPDVDLYAPR